MTRAALLIALVLAPATLAAQNSTAQSGNAAARPDFKLQSPLIVNPSDLEVLSAHGIPVLNCPVSMHATQGQWDHTIRVRNGQMVIPQPFGQRISLTLKDTHPARIIAATVRVRGLNGKSHMVETPASTGENWNAMRTMRVTFSEENDGSYSADLRIPGFTAVTSVELLDVSYDDGTSSQPSGPRACRITQPDPLMLISNR